MHVIICGDVVTFDDQRGADGVDRSTSTRTWSQHHQHQDTNDQAYGPELGRHLVGCVHQVNEAA